MVFIYNARHPAQRAPAPKIDPEFAPVRRDFKKLDSTPAALKVRDAKIRKMFSQGYSYEQICAATGYAQLDTLQHRMRKLGLITGPQRGRGKYA